MKFFHCVFCIFVLIFIFSVLVKFSQKKWNYIQEGNTDCQTTSKIETYDSNKSDFCNSLELQKVFIVDCSDDIYPSQYEGDCPGRQVRRIYDADTNQSYFDLYDESGVAINKNTLIDYKGEIGIDIQDGNGTEVRMDDVALSSGTKTDCGLRWQIPINESNTHACNFYFGINETD
jgi:hypothetical protein